MESLGRTIRRIRKRRGETMTSFAEHLGVNQSVISRYEADRVAPSRGTLMLLLQLASESEERAALLGALGVSQAALDESLIEALQEFHEYGKLSQPKSSIDPKADFANLASQIIKSQRVLDPAINDLLRSWLDHPSAEAGEAFRDVADFLQVRLARIAREHRS